MRADIILSVREAVAYIDAHYAANGHLLSESTIRRALKPSGAAPSLTTHTAGVASTAVFTGVRWFLGDGHSLRAGFATAAARAGEEERDIMRKTGH
jgi:hypothetical protein